MKTLALLFMILGVVVMFFGGFMGLMGFAFAFDAPGSADDPSVWLIAILMFTLPILIPIVILIFSFLSYRKGNYGRAVLISAIFPLLIVGFTVLSVTSTYFSMKEFNAQREQQAEDERLYPKQTYLRAGEYGADTILVFPDRIVAYRLNVGVEYPYNGPLGDLNESRDTLLYRERPDTKLTREELSQFTDANGRKFTEVYAVK